MNHLRIAARVANFNTSRVSQVRGDPKMNNLIIKSIKHLPDEITYGDEDLLEMPSFIVKGTWKGQKFKYLVSVRFDGSDTDISWISGAWSTDDADEDEWKAEVNKMYEAVYASADYKRLLEEHKNRPSP